MHDRQSGETTRASVNSTGGEGDDVSQSPFISGNGQFVAFWSHATNLVAGDKNGAADIFVHDRQTGETTRVSVDTAGNEVSGAQSNSPISAEGRFVAFRSEATNLVSDDTNEQADIFLHDRETGITTRVSTDSFGNEVKLMPVSATGSGNPSRRLCSTTSNDQVNALLAKPTYLNKTFACLNETNGRLKRCLLDGERKSRF